MDFQDQQSQHSWDVWMNEFVAKVSIVVKKNEKWWCCCLKCLFVVDFVKNTKKTVTWQLKCFISRVFVYVYFVSSSLFSYSNKKVIFYFQSEFGHISKKSSVFVEVVNVDKHLLKMNIWCFPSTQQHKVNSVILLQIPFSFWISLVWIIHSWCHEIQELIFTSICDLRETSLTFSVVLCCCYQPPQLKSETTTWHFLFLVLDFLLLNSKLMLLLMDNSSVSLWRIMLVSSLTFNLLTFASKDY